MFEEYVLGKQTLIQLAIKFKLSTRSVQRYLDQAKIPELTHRPRSIILVLDALYFGEKKDKDGLIVGKDWVTKNIVYYKFIKSETKAVFQDVKDTLEQIGYEIQALVVDGRPGIKSVFKDIPIQMCQFHQIQIVNRYLTKNPKLTPSIQLKTIIEDLTLMNKLVLESRFNYWLGIHQDFINEKSINPETKRQIYKHKKLRSAVNSIKNNLPYLFTHKINVGLDIPNTTNSLDGWFTHLRKLLNCHGGLVESRRNRVIEYILATRFV